MTVVGHAVALRANDQTGVWRADTLDDANDAIARLAALDAAADHIRVWDSRFIPALLQTPRYSFGVISRTAPHLPQSAMRERNDVKYERVRAFLSRLDRLEPAQDGPHARFVLGAEALTQPWNHLAHLEQLMHLARMADHPQVSIQILPRDVLPGTTADQFVLYSNREQPNRLPMHAVYAEHVVGGIILTRRTDTATVIGAFSDLSSAAMGPRLSRQRIQLEVDRWRGPIKGPRS